MADSVTFPSLVRIIEFLYTGITDLSKADTFLAELIIHAKTFDCPHLVTMCENVVDKLEFVEVLNASIGTWLNDEVAAHMKELYFNKAAEGADVKLVVEGEGTIYAHKLVLMARSPVMATMFTGGFSEAAKGKQKMTVPDVDERTLAAFIEYLYTDHAPLEEVDCEDLIILANMYGSTRLVTLCELYETRVIDRAIADGIAKADIDIIDILLHSQDHNAAQLAAFCLHFIAANYGPMSKRKEFKVLEGENLRSVEEQQWPPKKYLEEVAEYEAQMKGDEKCSIM